MLSIFRGFYSPPSCNQLPAFTIYLISGGNMQDIAHVHYTTYIRTLHARMCLLLD